MRVSAKLLKKVINLCANNYLGLSSHPEVIQGSISEDAPLVFDFQPISLPIGLTLPLDVRPEDEAVLIRALRSQGQETPYILLRKILTVLRWKCRRLGQRDRALETIVEFSESLHSGGASLELDAMKPGAAVNCDFDTYIKDERNDEQTEQEQHFGDGSGGASDGASVDGLLREWANRGNHRGGAAESNGVRLPSPRRSRRKLSGPGA